MFAPPDARPFPGLHWFGSDNWTAEADVSSSPYGEIRHSPREYRDGGGGDLAPSGSLAGIGECCVVKCEPPSEVVCDGTYRLARYLRITARWLDWVVSFSYVYVGAEDVVHSWQLFGWTDSEGPVVRVCPTDITTKWRIREAWLTPSPVGPHFIQWNCVTHTYTINFVSEVTGLIAQGWTIGTVAPDEMIAEFPPLAMLTPTTISPAGDQWPCGGRVVQEKPLLILSAIAGQDVAAPIVLPPREPPDPWPAACYGADPEALRFNPYSKDFALAAAEILCLQYSNPNAAASKMLAYTGPTYTQWRWDNDAGPVPGMLIARKPGRCFVAVSGTTNLLQFTYQALSVLLPPQDRGSYSTSQPWDEAAALVGNRIASAGATVADDLVIVGHSYGAAIAEIVAWKLSQANPLQRIFILVFGAPPVGRLGNLAGYPPTIVRRRITNIDDPIQLVPPHETVLFQIALLVPGMPIPAWRLWRHPIDGTQLTPDGTLVPGGDNAVGILDLVDILAGIIAGGTPDPGVNHYMPEYVRRLTPGLAPLTLCGRP